MTRNSFDGPALLSIGFRPFFLVAVLFGLVAIPLWWLVWRGEIVLSGPFTPLDWHVHEMLFGYAAAVIAGFLFTAVPNWTGRMPKQGWPLAMLALVWLAGRLAVAGALPLGAVATMAVDGSFLALLGVVFLIEIIAGRNLRNLKVVVPILLLCLANLTFHIEAMTSGGAKVGGRLGLAVVVFLIVLIGGRIVPSFTRNWLSARGETRMPLPFGRVDAMSVALTEAALVSWVLLSGSQIAAALLGVAGILQFVRLARWRGIATWREPLLLMLHVGYSFVPLGLLALAGGVSGLFSEAVALHLLGIGAIGCMTLAVMIRATRGHTGRSLTAGPALSLAFALIVAAALSRSVAAFDGAFGIGGVTLAALSWTLGYAIVAVRLAPWLIGESDGRKVATGKAAKG